MAPTKESYEEIRKRNIATNRALLLSLQLSGPGVAPIVPPKKVVATPEARPPKKKRPAESRAPRDSAAYESLVEVPEGGRRRSGRIQLRKETALRRAELPSEYESESESESDYASGAEESGDDSPARVGKKRKGSGWVPPREPKRRRGADPPKRKARCLTGARPNPKVFGHQKGVEVGDWWDSRMSCSQAGVHAPPVSGIAASEAAGCWSVALSGGYEDDVDLGYAFTFTGSGGRALAGTPGNPKNLRTAPQTFDQEFTSMNAGLQVSSKTKKPVRVIRGYKNHSPFAPEDGYRYDGLYRVEKAWREAGQSGYQVCKFAFVRLPNQPKIPVKEGREAEAEQMYRDMGFKVQDLPASPEKRQQWSRKLAKSRAADPAGADAEEECEEATEDLTAAAVDEAQTGPVKTSEKVENDSTGGAGQEENVVTPALDSGPESEDSKDCNEADNVALVTPTLEADPSAGSDGQLKPPAEADGLSVEEIKSVA